MDWVHVNVCLLLIWKIRYLHDETGQRVIIGHYHWSARGSVVQGFFFKLKQTSKLSQHVFVSDHGTVFLNYVLLRNWNIYGKIFNWPLIAQQGMSSEKTSELKQKLKKDLFEQFFHTDDEDESSHFLWKRHISAHQVSKVQDRTIPPYWVRYMRKIQPKCKINI